MGTRSPLLNAQGWSSRIRDTWPVTATAWASYACIAEKSGAEFWGAMQSGGNGEEYQGKRCPHLLLPRPQSNCSTSASNRGVDIDASLSVSIGMRLSIELVCVLRPLPRLYLLSERLLP